MLGSDSYPICRSRLPLNKESQQILDSTYDATGLHVCALSANRVKPNARRNIMHFGLLLSQLPHVRESRVHYDAMLALHAREPHKFAAFWQHIKALIS